MPKTNDLKLLQQANVLGSRVINALKEGDTPKAHRIIEERLSVLQRIDFKAAQDENTEVFNIALDEFESRNNNLLKMSEAVKDNILEKLKAMRLSRSAAKTYQEIGDS